MAEKRRTRGPHPEDARLFAPDAEATLRLACIDLAWLLSRGYAPNASLSLVGDRFALRRRQRDAVRRSTCSDAARDARASRRLAPEDIVGRRVLIDGFNLLITLETALDGGVLLEGRDGCVRDLASLHGTYRRCASTDGAFGLVAATLAPLKPGGVRWLFDRPVSNSGRLAARLRVEAERLGLSDWRFDVVPNPDGLLKTASGAIATADSAVLDACGRWLNLAALTLDRQLPERRRLVLRSGPPQ